MIALPTVHMNGTHGPELHQANLDAHRAVRAAIEAVSRAAPHGRDYYVNRDIDQGIATAIKQHNDRLKALHSVSQELFEISMAVASQMDGKG